MKGFGSDNHASVHPEIMQSILNINRNHAPSYGTDQHSFNAINLFKEHFGTQTEVFFVFNGTASNVLSARFLIKRHESLLASDCSHLHHDECGAPEFFAGKIVTVPSHQGKMSLNDIKSFLVRKGDQHYSQIKAISLTQPTELGTCYSLNEIQEITDWAHNQGLFVHIDGARLANACAFLGCNFQEMTTDLGVDIVSFGGTKNGLMMGEAILVLNPSLAKIAKEELKYIRKQSAQLPSKTRFIACQFEAYLKNQLYLNIANHVCNMAERLFKGLEKISELEITCPRQSNAVFLKIPKEYIKKLKEKSFFYVWNEQTFECRLMMSWDTTPEEVDQFIDFAKTLTAKKL